MISIIDFQNIARTRLGDAQCLLEQGHLDGAFYLGGYAVEIALKTRLCKVENLAGFPKDKDEFKLYKQQGFINVSHKQEKWFSHDLENLKNLIQNAEQEKGMQSIDFEYDYSVDWGFVIEWKETKRYQEIGSYNLEKVTNFVKSIENILPVILQTPLLEQGGNS